MTIGSLLVGACALFLYVNRSPVVENPGWRVKGTAHVAVYYDRGGKVATLQSTEKLLAGDKFRVQVTAAVDSVAFYSVFKMPIESLMPLEDTWNQKISIKSGTKEFFDGSVELTGKSEQEYVVVVDCPFAFMNGKDPGDFKSDLEDYMKSATQPGMLKDCGRYQIPVR